MKTLILSAVLVAIASGSAIAGTPFVDKRQNNQAHRVYNGIQNGSLNFREAGNLIKHDQAIRQKERQFKSDGVVTLGERLRLNGMQTRQSIRIYNKKHN